MCKKILKKEIMIGVSIGLLVLSISSMVVGINNPIKEFHFLMSKGDTLYVGGFGPNNYSCIQEAIENASATDIIFVYNGIYYENIVIDKNEIQLIGEDWDNTVIDGSNKGDVVKIISHYVTLQNFTIKNSGNEESDAGIKAQGTRTKILNSYLTDNHRAIYLEVGSYLNRIQGNEIIDNYHGVYSYTGSMDNIIVDNVIKINNRSAIYLYGSDFNIIRGNTLSDSGNGVVINYGTENVVSNNLIENNIYCGILLIDMSNRNSIINNTVSKTINLEGIALVESSDNKIKNNTIIRNDFSGIGLIDASDNVISYNFVSENKEVGLSLSNSCENNIIKCNVFDGNVKTNFEIYSLCINNQFYSNNFLRNTLNILDDGDNSWDFNKKGNYWSDFEDKYPNAKKIWLKGIWDTPYEIPGGDNKDNYPLINEWTETHSTTIQKNRLPPNTFLMRLFERFPHAFPLLRHFFN